MRVLTVVGNRPQFVKAAAVSHRLRAVAEEVLVHTGQHHDDELSRVFFAEHDLPTPEHPLDLGGGSNTTQTGRMLEALEPLLDAESPDAVLVYGDTNSTLAGGLAAAQAQIPVAHVEAGMRSFDRDMPEELNRVLTDHLSSLLMCSSESSAQRLRDEAVHGQVVVVGDVMVDIFERIAQRAAVLSAALLEQHGLRSGGFAMVTAHRAGTVDDPSRLARLVDLLLDLPLPVIFPLHPRTRARLEAADRLRTLESAPDVVLTPPLGSLDFTALLLESRVVLTDSGGVQKEAYLAGVPCLTMRPRTEWTETVDAGWNTLVDLDAAAVRAGIERDPPENRPPLYGDGHAGERVVDALLAHLGSGR